MKNSKNSVISFVSLILFLLGLIIILMSDTWGLGSQTSMNLAGSILCVFAGILFFKAFFSK